MSITNRKIKSMVILTLLMLASLSPFLSAPTKALDPTSTNGFWMYPNEITPTNAAALAASNVSYVYPQIGKWDGSSIVIFPFDYEIQSAVINAHNAGLKIYAWIIEETTGDFLISTPTQRSAAFNQMIDLCNNYGFDGIADDVEGWHPTADFIAYFNGATTALNGEGFEYFTTIQAWYVHGVFSAGELAQIQVDRLQLMAYDMNIWYPYTTWEETYKGVIDTLLDGVNCPTVIGLGSFTGWTSIIPFADQMTYLTEQSALSNITSLIGFDVFDFGSTSSGEFLSWDDWALKDSTSYTPLPTPDPPIPTVTPPPTPTATPTDTTQVINYVTPTANVFYFVGLIGALLFGLILALKVSSIIGIAFGIVGFLGTAFFINAGVLIVSSYLDMNSNITYYELMPLGFYYLVPLLLSVILLVTPLIKSLANR